MQAYGSSTLAPKWTKSRCRPKVNFGFVNGNKKVDGDILSTSDFDASVDET